MSDDQLFPAPLDMSRRSIQPITLRIRGNELHCTCVPALRAELARVQAEAAAMRAKVKEISEDFEPGHERETRMALDQMREALGLALASSTAGSTLLAELEILRAENKDLKKRLG